MKVISAINCFVFVKLAQIWALEEIPAPNLSTEQNYYQPWKTLEQHTENTQELLEAARTLQHSVISQRRQDEQSGIYLPGLGASQDYSSMQRNQLPFKRFGIFIYLLHLMDNFEEALLLKIKKYNQ